MASNVHPRLSFTQEWVGTLIRVLDFFEIQGNILAKQRKSEIQDLVGTLSNDQPRSGNDIDAAPLDAANSPALTQTLDPPSFLGPADPFFGNWVLDEALSGDQIMYLATALDTGSLGSLESENTWNTGQLW